MMVYLVTEGDSGSCETAVIGVFDNLGKATEAAERNDRPSTPTWVDIWEVK